MGTRNLTVVFIDGEYKVAQYGQFDGYPEGQGAKCLTFLRDKMDENKFKEQVRKLYFASEEDLDTLWEKNGGDVALGTMPNDRYEQYTQAYPQLNRCVAAGILEMIQDGKIEFLHNSITFAADGLFCEWAYVIDFDKRMFEVYSCFDKRPLTENDRFYFLKDYESHTYPAYPGVKLVAAWSLDDLPAHEEFLKATSREEEDDTQTFDDMLPF